MLSCATILHALLAATLIVPATSALGADDNPFAKHGKLRVAKSGTYLEHTDGTPFFFLADTVWTGSALSTEEDWKFYLADRKKKGFTAIQFNCVSPWRTAADRSRRPHIVLDQGRQARPERSLLQATRCPTEGHQRLRSSRRASPGLGPQEGGRRLRSHRGASHHPREVRGRSALGMPIASSSSPAMLVTTHPRPHDGSESAARSSRTTPGCSSPRTRPA